MVSSVMSPDRAKQHEDRPALGTPDGACRAADQLLAQLDHAVDQQAVDAGRVGCVSGPGNEQLSCQAGRRRFGSDLTERRF
jgi:hypothetical protein